MSEQNLDRLCAEYGYKFCDEVQKKLQGRDKTDNHLTKSLGVLQEDGVYAFFLYQPAKAQGKGGEQVTQAAKELLKQAEIAPFANAGDDVGALELVRRERDGLAANLDNLLLAKRLLEQALIYARYHAKALPREENA